MRRLFFISMVIAVTTSHAQTLLTPGHSTFQQQWLHQEMYRMKWFMLNDTVPFEMGMVTTTVAPTSQTLIITTQVAIKGMKAPWIDSTIASIHNFTPIRHASYNMQRDMVLQFGATITGFYNDKMKKTNTVIHDIPASADYFDSNLYPYLITLLPLKPGYRTDLAIYDYNPAAGIGVMKAFVKNVSSGIYATQKSGERNVWIVTVADEIGKGENGTSIYYIDQQDRRIWKQEIDAGGSKMRMIRVEE